MNILIYIESKENKALGGSLELLSAGSAMGIVSAVAVENAETAQDAAGYGVPVALLKTGDTCPDAQVSALEAFIREQKPNVVLFSGSLLGKELAPRLAQRFGAGCVTDVTAMEVTADGIVYTRPAFGGTIFERIRLAQDKVQFATVRSGSYQRPASAHAEVTEIAAPVAGDSAKAKIMEIAKELTETIDLEGADVIVAGGRGMGDVEGFKLVEELAALLGGVVGASRPAIEEGWTTRAHQIGQSGKIVAPKLYIACGISGAMQHISGVMDSKYIVAINKDESASIFDIADAGIVGDVKVILPLLIEQIRQRKA